MASGPSSSTIHMCWVSDVEGGLTVIDMSCGEMIEGFPHLSRDFEYDFFLLRTLLQNKIAQI